MISIGNLQINKLCLGDVEVTKAYLGDVEVYGSTPQPVGKYMTITVDDSPAFTTISPIVHGSITPNLQYRINNGEWSDFIFGTTADIHLSEGDFVQFKGVNVNGISRSTTDYLNFYISGSDVTLSGNVMSLIDGVGDTLVIPNEYCFYGMFYQAYSIKTVSSDFLPATTLKDYCYREMFNRCSSLVTAPELPATTLAIYCYAYMFTLCTSLTTAPVLPATTLSYCCYDNMFAECTSLATAPVLPATTLAFYCYDSMFYKCTSLTTAPALPATMLVGGCYRDMFNGCTSLTTAPELPSTTLAEDCYMGLFNGCTSLTTAPALPATTLSNRCYKSMFQGCTSLNYIKSLATDITATNALKDWLSGVAATGTFVKPSGVTYPSGTSGIPSGWTVEEYVPKYMTMTVDGSAGSTTISPKVTGSLPNLNLQYRINNGNWNDFIVGTTADIIVGAGDVVQWKGLNKDGLSIDTKNYLNFSISNPVHMSGNVMSLIDGKGDELVIPCNHCFRQLFNGTKIKTVSKDFLPATTLTTNCYESMFQSCDALTTAPELPAKTLKDYCYVSMFQSCEALTTAPELPATTLGIFCYQFMFYLCSSLTTAPSVLPATTLKDYCYYYMFGYCSKLSRIKCLATNISATYCTSGWLSSVSSTGTFVKPRGVSYKSGSDGIPSGWTIQNI